MGFKEQILRGARGLPYACFRGRVYVEMQQHGQVVGKKHEVAALALSWVRKKVGGEASSVRASSGAWEVAN